MRRLPIALVLLMTFLTVLVIPTPGYTVTDKVVLQIEGMTGAAGPLIIKKALEGLEGVERADISLKEQKGEIFFDPDRVSESAIVEKVKQIGFNANVVEK